MKRTNLKRATSGVLSVAMIASALFSDFSVPTSVYASDDTTSVETSADDLSLSDYAEGTGSITSEYIAENLDEELGEEAAALNEDAAYMVVEEYLVSEASSNNTDVVTEDADATTDDTDDLAAEEVTVSEEEVAEIVTEIVDNSDDIYVVDDYDDNGIATACHYITLNYTLVDEDYVWDGMTINDIYSEVPEAFIASYLTTVNVYTLEDNEDYYVALIDPATLNGLGSAIYADFVDGDTFNPTVYNDIIAFDAETGLVYIPKSFYYNEEGEEVLKPLYAQVLVPYSFDNDETSVAVSVSSEIDGVEGISGTVSVPTLDVTTTVQIVDAEIADQISISDLCVTVNDDALPMDLTDGNAYYDTETGELTISGSPSGIYSLNVTISENIAEETYASIYQRDLLVASTGDLSNILFAESANGSVTYATTAEDMVTMPGVTVKIKSGSLTRGETMTYECDLWEYHDYGGTTTDPLDVVTYNTAPYSYYFVVNGSGTEIVGDVWASVMDASGNAASGTSHLMRATDSASVDTLYNRVITLPSTGDEVDASGGAVTEWTTDISANGSGYETMIALHCSAATSAATYQMSGTNEIITMRVLYIKEPTQTENGYLVFSITTPTSSTQAGSGVLKVVIEPYEETGYYAKFGIKKVSSTNSNATLGGAQFEWVYSTTSYDASDLSSAAVQAASLAETVRNGGSTTNASSKMGVVVGGFGSHGIITSSSSGVKYKSFSSDNSSVLKRQYDGTGYTYVYLWEYIVPDDYDIKVGAWKLTIQPSETDGGSKITAAVYYEYDSNGNLVSTENVEISSNAMYVSLENDESTRYGKFAVKKLDGDGNTYKATSIKFNVYSDSSCSTKVTTISTDTSTGIATFTKEYDSSTEVTYYVKEDADSVPDGMEVNTDVYEVTITPGSESDYSDQSISVKNYTTSGSVSVSSSTFAFQFENEYKTFQGGFAIQKVDDSGKAITSNASGIVFNVYTTYSSGKLSGKVATLTTGSNGKTGSYTYEWDAEYDASNTTATFYVQEDASSSAAALNRLNMDADTDVYQVVITGSTSSVNASTIAVTDKTDSSKSVSVTNSTSTISYFNYGNTQLTSYTVTKEFGDINTSDKVVNVTVYLYADGTKVDEYTLTEADNNWSHTFTDLPMYNSKKEVIEYTSEEKYVTYVDITGTERSNVAYSTAKTAFTISNGGVASSSGAITNTLKTESYPVMKILPGDAGDYIESVEFTLYANSANLNNVKIDTVC